jgi:hypothetical protein
MPVAVCPGCQARYKVPDAAAGKKTTCKVCGAAFRIPDAAEKVSAPTAAPPAAVQRSKPAPRAQAPAPPPAASDFGDFDALDALSSGQVIEVERPAPQISPAVAPATAPAGARATTAARPTAYVPRAATVAAPPNPGAAAYANYLAAVGKSFLFVTKPGNLITFVLFWFLLAGAQILSNLGVLLMMTAFIIYGWYMAFQLNVVQWAAGQEEELPGMVADGGWWDDIIVPFFQMLGIYIYAFLPVVVFLITLVARLAAAELANTNANLEALPSTASFVALAITGLIGGFAWPMAVLVVACGGSIRGLFALDLILETIFRSFPAYLLTLVAVYISWGLRIAVGVYVAEQIGAGASWRSNATTMLLLPAALSGVNLYFDIIAMRAIGYYYAAFKHKFAWAWD